MTEYSNKPATNKLTKTGLYQTQHNHNNNHQPQSPHHQKSKASLLKHPLAVNSPQKQNRTKTVHQKNQRNVGTISAADLSDESLKTNVQIVLNNINNALKEPLQQRYQSLANNNLNIFGKFANSKSTKRMSSPAECDNTNNNTMGPLSMLACSFASSQDFTHDNSDYQWFVDYG